MRYETINNSRSSSSSSSSVGLWVSLLLRAATAARLVVESPLALRTTCEGSDGDDKDAAIVNSGAGRKDTAAESPLRGTTTLSSTLTAAAADVMFVRSSDTSAVRLHNKASYHINEGQGLISPIGRDLRLGP